MNERTNRMNIRLALLIAALVVFILTALGVQVAGFSSVEEVAVGLALFTAAHI